ncbi:MAG TPA: DUF6569 family protein [Pyrinomonadaceae bacterium]|nr:DUF6569 family protein [Pyrinomonadaceae bacterium]
MKKKTFALLMALTTFVVGVAIARFSLPNLRRAPAVRKTNEVQLGNYRLSGPYQHENLTIFLVHGPDQANSRMFTPLEEAMARKVVIVHETNDVNELAIENVSTTEEVFVQAGDIVKGGRQDRVLSVDLILPAKSGKLPVSAFCVENGRWSQRGLEPTGLFTVSEGMIASKGLKLAAKRHVSQQQVWDEVRVAQDKLSAGVNADVRSDVSQSSLHLAQQNEKVLASGDAYINKLSSIVEGSNDVIGFAFAINNELNSADIYSSTALFKRFWPRLLKTAAIEAIGELMYNENQKKEFVSIAATMEFLTASERGAESVSDITARTRMLKRDAERSVFFETRDMNHGGAWIHRNYLTK